MKKFIFLVNLLYFLLLTDPAHAGPVAAAIAAIAGIIKAGGIAGLILKTLLSVALNFGMSLIQKALMKKQKVEQPGVEFEARVGDDQPLRFIMGYYATAGKRVYIGTRDTSDDTPNQTLIDVIELGNMPSSSNTLRKVWVGDKAVKLETIDVNEAGSPVREYRKKNKSDGKPLMRIKYYDGSQTVPDPYLRTVFSGDPVRPWMSKMIGRGIPYAIITMVLSQKNPNLSSVPNILFEYASIPLYDIRKDSTNGGSGSHRWGDRSTYEASDNPVVMIYNIIRGIYYSDTEWMYGGQNLEAFRLPASNWIAAANECDVLVDVDEEDDEGNIVTKKEKQFRAGIEIKGDILPTDAIESLRQSCNARIAENGGIFKILVGAPGAAVYSFTDENIVVTKNQSFEPFPALSEIYNGIEAVYPEPKERWSNKDAPPRYSDAYEAEDGNRRLATGISFASCPFPNQIQRLMKAMIQEERRFRVHSFYLPPDAYALEPNDVVSWTSVRNGYNNKKFLVIRIEGDPSFNQLVLLREIDPSDYDWDIAFQLPTSTGPVGPVPPFVQPATGTTVTATAILDDNGFPRRPSITITVADDLENIERVWVQVRIKGSTAIVYNNDGLKYEEPHQWVLAGNWLLPNKDYEVRVMIIPNDKRIDSEWSGWFEVHTLNLLIAEEDILDNSITSGKIRDAAITAAKIMDDAITALKIADGSIGVTKFASGLEPVNIIDSPTLPTSKSTTNISFQGKLYTWSDAENAYVSATVGPGSITQTEIADGSITTPKLVANAVTTAILAADSITGAKIQAGAISAREIAANAITAKQLAIGSFDNLLVNGDFSQGLDGWTNNNAAWGSQKEGSATSPVNYYAFLNVGTAGVGTWQLRGENQFAVTPGEEYYIEAMVQAGSGSFSGNARIQMQFQDTTGTTSTYVRIPDTAIVDSLGWTKVSGSITVPALAGGNPVVKARIWIEVRDITNADGVVRFSNLYMKKKNGGELIVDGSITGQKIYAGTIGAREIAANSITAKQLVLTDFSNLYPNGDFKDTTKDTMDSIFTFGGASYVESGSGAGPIFRYTTGNINVLTGTRSLYILNSSTPVSMYMDTKEKILVSPGDQLYWEVKLRASATTTAGFYFRFYWFDSTDTATATSSTTVANNVGVSSTFETKSGKVTVPAGATQCIVRMYNHTTNTAGAGFVISSVLIQKARAAQLIVDGGITADMIQVNSLSAISATLGTVNISNAIIGTLQVGQSNIVQGAVTNTASAFTEAGISLTSGDNIEIQSATVTSVSGASVLLSGSFLLEERSAGNASSSSVLVQIYRGTSLRTSFRNFVPWTYCEGGGDFPINGRAGGLVSFNFREAPGAGTFEYRIVVRKTDYTHTCAQRFLSLLVTAR